MPGGYGEALGDLYRSWLSASSVIGPAYDRAANQDQDQDQDRQTLPELTGTERVAVAAVCALAAAIPGTVLGYCRPELEALTGALAAAVRSGRGN